MNDLIAEGDNVLLGLGQRKTYLVRVEKGKSFHTHKGFVKLDDTIGREFGSPITSSLGFEFVAMRPMLCDYIMKCARQTQIMYPKDIALIVMFSGIGPGSRVVEAGTGTAAMTTALAHYVKPDGKIYSYEIRDEFRTVAEKNLQRAGLLEFVELKNKDVTIGIDEDRVDAVILDLAVPWLVIAHAYKALKPSASIVTFSPTIDQVIRTVDALRNNSFTSVETVECMMRGMQVEPGRTRPQTLMTGHSGYITCARTKK
jgi:tRNA (adenine57-N1/adenine58-N1)-methyltransferase